MNNELKILTQFLEIPIGCSDGVFERFMKIPNAIFRGQDQELFLYVRGRRKNKVLLVAHADTAWDRYSEEPFNSKHEVIFDNGIVKSGTTGCGIGADDRAGCSIVWLLKDIGHSLLITDGEERGLLGSSWLMTESENSDIADEINDEHRFVIQFDRRNGTDFKCYSVGTDSFRKYIEQQTSYEEPDRIASTDIVNLCQNIAGVNLSIGYYNEHESDEYLNVEEWKNSLELCRRWLSEMELPRFTEPVR